MLLFQEERSPLFLCFVPFSGSLLVFFMVGTESITGYDGKASILRKEVLMKTTSLKEWTYDEFMSLPEGGPFRYEILDGDLCMTPSPNTRHQKISLRLSFFLESFLRNNRLGEVFSAPYDVVFSKDPPQVAVPDLVFVSKEHLFLITEKNIQGAPDLLVEILSEGTATRDRRKKHSLYERFGVCEYWIVDPKSETVQVFRLVDGHYVAPLEYGKGDLLDSPLLPGLSIPLSEVFPS
jgi:Uma2 family endonuclease